ncbi:MBL fold metallo-hydrolase [Leptospira sarikeiensis]|uniref:MBL fold metallo-hydrolase n=1 Tax=Leptospira sarikeiensis TaxID=2484943 RepID=A0A4R9K5X7_9LEPT|nr:MBL fold metallo-hydrolase [Leptospira sarikeiensis]TGL60933.1 MBL fold metallo-hydrolase [Leptospira sarikeiensis]
MKDSIFSLRTFAKIFSLLICISVLKCGTSSSKSQKENPPIPGSNLPRTSLENGFYAILVGKSFYPNRLTNSETREGDSEIAHISFLIKLEKHYILIDSGTSSNVVSADRVIHNWISPDKILGTAGIKPSMIQEIILTNFHPDHSNGIGLFPNAKIYITPNDWATLKEINRSKPFLSKLLSIERSKRIQFIQSSLEVFPNFRILITGGNTKGSIAIEWLKNSNQKFLITGDECYWIEFCKNGIGLPSEVAYSILNNQQFLDYVSIVSSSGTKVFTMHDPSIFSSKEEVFPRIYKLD